MQTDNLSQQPTASRCDLCGRETTRPKPYHVYSTVDTLSMIEDGGEKQHDFVVGPGCELRKIYFLVAVISIMAGGIISLLKSENPTFLILGFLLTLLLAGVSGRFLPFQRLARRVRSERGEAVSAASPNLSFRIVTSALSQAERTRLISRYRGDSQPPIPKEKKEAKLDGILIFFTKDFEPKDTFINSILTKMTARERTYKEWMTERTPVRILVNPAAQDPMTIMMNAMVQFSKMRITPTMEKVEHATFEGSHGISGTIITHWSSEHER